MKKLLLLTFAIFSCGMAFGQANLTVSSYQQDFNSLAATGASSVLPQGWALYETGASITVNGQYAAGTGSLGTGDTYSYGTTSLDRAFGGLLSGTMTPTFGAQFRNFSGAPVSSVTITYTGELWRLGTSGRADRLDFQYSLDAASLSGGTWSDLNQLDFSTPDITGTAGARNGNVAPFRTTVTATITGLNIAPGATLFIRWTDFNASGADDGLAVDDFQLSFTNGPVVVVDNTPPANVAGFPKIQNITTASADLLSSLDENGTTYYVLIPASGAAPTTVAQVKAGQDGNGAAAFKSGSFPVTENTAATVGVTGLSAGTAYNVYVVSQDAASSPNLQSAFSTLSFTTPVPQPTNTPVIISQYYEGTSTNKWIELTNLSGAPVNTASPQLRLGLYGVSGDTGTMNITAAPSQTVNLTVTIPAYGNGPDR